MGTGKVVAVTVTYGARLVLLRRTVTAAFVAGVDQLVVVANGATDHIDATTLELGPSEAERLRVVNQPSNLGSASGFKVGIQEAARLNPSFIWLLDDDNPPAHDALGPVISELSRDCAWAVFSFRPEQRISEFHRAGLAPDLIYPAASAFLTFDILHYIRRRFASHSHPKDVIDIPYGPYGGMLFRPALIHKIGLPDENFVLYEDDTEFTNRVRRAGGRLRLVLASRIHDAEQPWHKSSPGWGPQKHLLAPSDVKVYYSVRNRVFLERHRWGHAGPRYRVNQFIVVLTLLVFALPSTRWRRLLLILRAINDGIDCRLGSSLPLS